MDRPWPASFSKYKDACAACGEGSATACPTLSAMSLSLSSMDRAAGLPPVRAPTARASQEEAPRAPQEWGGRALSWAQEEETLPYESLFQAPLSALRVVLPAALGARLGAQSCWLDPSPLSLRLRPTFLDLGAGRCQLPARGSCLRPSQRWGWGSA